MFAQGAGGLGPDAGPPLDPAARGAAAPGDPVCAVRPAGMRERL